MGRPTDVAWRKRLPIGALTSYGGFVLLWACIASLVSRAASETIPVSTPFVAVTLAGVWFAGGMTDREVAPRARMFAAIASCGLAPGLAAMAGLVLAKPPLFTTHYRCGLGSMAWFILASFSTVVGVVLSTLVAKLASHRFRRDEAIVRWLAATLTAIALLGVALASVNAVRRPAPDSYAASLPVLARFDPTPADGASEQVAATNTGSFFRGRDGNDCFVRVAGQSQPSGQGAELCQPLDVRYAPAADAFLFTHTRSDEPRVVLALSPNGVPTTIALRSIRGDVSAPRGWLALAWLGVVAAIAALVKERRVRRELRLRSTWASGTLDERGWVHFDDGSPPRCAPNAAALRKGPVLVDLRDVAAAPYRGEGSSLAATVLPMSVEELREHAESRALALSAFAIASLALAWAPLAAAAMKGVAF